MLIACLIAASCTSHYNSNLNVATETKIQLADSRITESSGLAESTIRAGRFFTHNDSGDTARIFAFDATGKHLGILNLAGVKAVDCEDMASASLNGRALLYLGDIGDNGEKRKEINVYRVTEPATIIGEQSVAAETFTLRYPDGPHNAETLLVNPVDGRITIVVKTDKGAAGIYGTSANPTPGANTLTRLGQISVSSIIPQGKLITGGAWSHDGKRVVLTTYLTAMTYGARSGDWWKATPQSISVPFQIQREAITFSDDGNEVLVSAEGKPCIVYRIPFSTSSN